MTSFEVGDPTQPFGKPQPFSFHSQIEISIHRAFRRRCSLGIFHCLDETVIDLPYVLFGSTSRAFRLVQTCSFRQNGHWAAQRACQAYLWALPMVSAGELEHVYMQGPGAAYGDIMSLDTFPDLSRFLTAHATTPYTLAWFNLAKSGPYVVELPAGPTAGMVDDLWQRPVTDLGLRGPDKGQGGKVLVLGPGQTAPGGTEGYIVVRSSTFNNFMFLRLLATDPQERQAMLGKIRLYPVSQRANPPATKVIRLDQGGRSFAIAPRGLSCVTRRYGGRIPE